MRVLRGRIEWSDVVFHLEATGMSQREIAAACGVDHSTINKLKNIPGTEPRFHWGALLLGLWMERTGGTGESVPRGDLVRNPTG